MIRLTSAWTKEYILVNPDHVVDFGKGTCQQQEATYITTVCNVNHNDTLVFVTESPEEVARKVLEWRLAWEGGDVETLYQMAGLEEQKDE